MIVVKDIEIMHVDDFKKIVSIPNIEEKKDRTNSNIDDIFPIEDERIYYRRFINNKGKEIYIGMAKKVQEAIGLPFEIFEEMNKRMAILINQCTKKQEEINQYEAMNFWDRLKFLFKGRNRIMVALEDEIEGKDQIYHICVRYENPDISPTSIRFMTGHMIMAKTPEKALELANKHHIGNPMGKTTNIKYRKIYERKPYTLEFAMEERRGDIWYEDENGNLKGIKLNKKIFAN